MPQATGGEALQLAGILGAGQQAGESSLAIG
eukprot:CAMPEP_0179076918 /NCGR_PEP_ID=MMETSP0796-20121207/34350_1 /TAXON_ID=73915 /ORGANISM="Pyrodinium bahamense, Strain pbaha01" /LENGTH=30 /DNA_ID= /DNA_START= /DNA_END= /DNA_ORIENTATION=